MERRLWTYALLGAAVAMTTVGLNMKESLQERQVTDRPPPLAFEPGAYLQDMLAFLPVEQTSLRDRTLSIVVDKEWLLRTYDERHVDAESAHVFLLNRNVPRLLLVWADGQPIAQFDGGTGQWFDADLSAKDAPPAAGAR